MFPTNSGYRRETIGKRRRNFPKARRLTEKKTRADERFAMGEKVTVSFQTAIQRCQDSVGGSLKPFLSYEWWSEARCREGLVYVCPATLHDLITVLDSAAPEFREADAPRLGGQGKCRLCMERGRLHRVVDLMVLRVKSPKGKYLIGGERIFSSESSRQAAIEEVLRQQAGESDEEQEEGPLGNQTGSGSVSLLGGARLAAMQIMVMNLDEQRSKPKKQQQEDNPLDTRRSWRFPTAVRPLGGGGVGRLGGLAEIRQAIDSMIAEQLHAKPDTLQVFDSSASVEVTTEKFAHSMKGVWPSHARELRVIEVRRRHYFDAIVNQEAGRSTLSQIGMPAERPFQTSVLPADDIMWVWADEEDCDRLGVEVRIEPLQTDPILRNFRAIPAHALRV
eukprot:s2210_g2.t1